MRKLLLGITLLYSLIFCYACSLTSSQDVRLLQEAIQYAEDKPEHAQMLIDSIFLPEQHLDKHAYMQYLVTRVQVGYKNFKDISTDTMIFNANAYFDAQKLNRDPFLFLSHFYTACVYREQGRDEQAIKAYKRALSIAEDEKDEAGEALVYYNIGDLYFNQNAHERAFDYYKNAVARYTKDTTKMLIALQAAGRSALLIGQIDTAMLFFDKSIDMAEKTLNKAEQAKSLHSKSVAYHEAHRFQEAIPLLVKAKTIDPDSASVTRYNLNLARTYLALGKIDSASYYTHQLEDSIGHLSDRHLKSAVSEFLAELYSNQANYPLAIRYLQIKDSCNMQIMQQTNVEQLANAEHRYDLATKETQLNQERARTYRLGLVLAVCSFAILIILGLGVYLHIRHKRQKKESLRLKQQAATNQCLMAVYGNYVSNITLFKDTIENLIVKYTRAGNKEVFVGYQKIRQLVDTMDSKINIGNASIIKDYLTGSSLLKDSEIKQLKSDDQLLVALLHAKVKHIETAGLLRITKHALTSRKSRLRNKLVRMGIKENIINKIFKPN